MITVTSWSFSLSLIEASIFIRLIRARAPSSCASLSEKFHIEPNLLTKLNPKVSFDVAGTKIIVPNIATKPLQVRVAKIVVNKSTHILRVLDADGKLISFYPASVGSDERPAPSGTRHILSVVDNPVYYYSPSLKFKGVKTRCKPSETPPVPTIPLAARGSILGTVMGSMVRRSRRTSAGPTHTDASASPIGMPRLWGRWFYSGTEGGRTSLTE